VSLPSIYYQGFSRPLRIVPDVHLSCSGFRVERGCSVMPEKETLERAQEDAREGKSPSTQAGEFVREEMHHIREGKHGAKSTKQAIAIGLSKARRAGVKLQAPSESSTSEKTRQQAVRESRAAKSRRKPSRKRSAATSAALKREGRSAASKKSLSSQAKKAASRRGASSRRQSALKAARTRRKESTPTGRASRSRRAA
jgi:hypothetical protein